MLPGSAVRASARFFAGVGAITFTSAGSAGSML